MDILFSNPTYLWFLLATPLLVLHHFSSLKKVKGQVLQFANFKAIARITGMQPQQTNLYVLIGRVMILTFIVFAVAGTIIWYSGTSGDSDYVLAIDASSSMLANDITPTRLEAAKETGLLFIELVPPKSKVGLLTFSGTAFVKTTLDNRPGDTKDAIKNIEVEAVSGTDIGDAIITATNMLLASDKGKTIIVLTDGRSNVGMNPLQTLSYVNKNNANVHTIGIGTEEGGVFEGVNMSLTLDEDTLQIVANQTGGIYFRARSKEEIIYAYNQIMHSGERKLSIDISPYLMLAALMVVFVDWGLVSTKYRRIP